jgi:hypothetical protein
VKWEVALGNFLIFDFRILDFGKSKSGFFVLVLNVLKRSVWTSATIIYRTGAMCHYLHFITLPLYRAKVVRLTNLTLYHFTMLK